MYFSPPQEVATSSMLAGRPKLATDTWETTSTEDDAELLRAWPDELLRKTMSNRDPERTGYPTQKPLALATRMVSASCPPGGLVVDPMSGSATLAVAAVLLGRNAIAGDRGAIARDVARARLLHAGATVRLDSLDNHVEILSWTGSAPFTRAGATVALHTPAFPQAVADQVAAAVVGAPSQRRILEVAATDGESLWSGWGVALASAPSELLAWIDGGPGRTRGPVSMTLELPDTVASDAPIAWWGCDVLGRLWRWLEAA